jgi:hypothetical protein
VIRVSLPNSIKGIRANTDLRRLCERDAEEFRNRPFVQTSEDGVVQFDSGGASEGNTQSSTSGGGEQNADSEQHRQNRERTFD